MVLDLLGMDNNPPEDGSNGGGPAVANGGGGGGEGSEEGAKHALMLTEMAPLPSMMGPVAAARGSAAEMAALCAEVRSTWYIFVMSGVGVDGGRKARSGCTCCKIVVALFFCVFFYRQSSFVAFLALTNQVCETAIATALATALCRF